MTDLAFSSEGLRAGGGASGGAGDTAEGAATALRGAACPPAASFGLVSGTDVLAAAVGRARDAHARVGTGVSDGLREMARQAVATAGQGDGLVSGTSAVAGSVPTAQP